MGLNRLFIVGLVLLTPVEVLAALTIDNSGTKFSVTQETDIPGQQLKKGDYSIQVLDRLSDRMIVRIQSIGGKVSTFLAIPSHDQSTPGPIYLNSGVKGKTALRGFSFPDGTVAEFVYPKADAVSLAKKNDTYIPAIDSQSEGLPAESHLSSSDMQMVTLWMLSPTRVGPGSQPGMLAKKIEPSVQPSSVAAENVQPQHRPPTGDVPYQASIVSVAPVPHLGPLVEQPKTQRKAPLMASLPHTASDVWSMVLAFFLALVGAATLTSWRKAQVSQT